MPEPTPADLIAQLRNDIATFVKEGKHAEIEDDFDADGSGGQWYRAVAGRIESALSLYADTASQLQAFKDSRDRVRASFGHQRDGVPCQCVYCRQDAEGLEDHAADYEMRAFNFENRLTACMAQLADVEAQRDLYAARLADAEKSATEEAESLRLISARLCNHFLTPERLAALLASQSV